MEVEILGCTHETYKRCKPVISKKVTMASQIFLCRKSDNSRLRREPMREFISSPFVFFSGSIKNKSIITVIV